MYTEKQKEFLHTEGYLLLDMKELYPNEFTKAEKSLQNIVDNKKFNILMTNHTHPNFPIEVDTLIDELGLERVKNDEIHGEQHKLEVLNEYIVGLDDYTFVGQNWMYIMQQNNLFQQFKKDISSFFYDLDEDEVKIMTDRSEFADFTLYLPGHQTPDHQDGCESGRMMVFLSYFSKDYKDGGGEFKFVDVHGEEKIIIPEYGKVLVLDFTDKNDVPRNNLHHSVTKVKSFRRYCYLGSLNSIK
jgi:hypothetical protein|tara:strand:- start:1410 stop:2138 length:729 start_codon:yes stop_codon:yes gene_type:complete